MRHESVLSGPSGSAPPSVDARLAAVARHGIVKVAHLRAVGLTGTAVSKRCRRGVLYRVHPGVYALGHADLSREARWIAAVYAAGDGAALSHHASAALFELRRYPPREPDVLVPRRHRPVPGVRMHACRRLDPRDVTEHMGIPVTTVARTLVDLTDALTAAEIANLIHEAAYRKRFSLAATRRAMERANGRHNLDRLRDAIDMHLAGSAGTKSDPERAFLALVAGAGLPAPLPNVEVLGVEVDAHWPGRKLVVEVDGPGHARPRTRREDRARDRGLAAAGYTILRFTAEQVENRPTEVLDSVRREHARRPA